MDRLLFIVGGGRGHSESIQRMLFDMGYGWANGARKTVAPYTPFYIRANQLGGMSNGSSLAIFFDNVRDSRSYKVIDLRGTG